MTRRPLTGTDDDRPRADRLTAARQDPVTRPYPTFGPLSAASHAPFWDREDPFHDVELFLQQPVYWDHRRWRLRDGRRQLVSDYRRHDTPGNRSDWKRLCTAPRAHQIVALLHAFGHATARQLCAATDLRPNHTDRYLKPLYEFGVLKRGRFQADHIPGKKPYLYTLNDDRPLRRFLASLDAAATSRILGEGVGKPRLPYPQARHDLLTLELGLRVLETQPNIVSIGGPASAAPATLLPFPDRRLPRFEADLVLHRHDGLRIVVELAASRNKRHLTATLRKWAQLLASLPRHESRLVVVVVNAERRRHTNTADVLRRQLVDVTAHGTLKVWPYRVPAWPYDCQQAGAQIHLASWDDWFPADGGVTEAGRGMYTTATLDGKLWTAQSLTDPASFGLAPGRNFRVPTPTDSAAVPSWAGSLGINSPGDRWV